MNIEDEELSGKTILEVGSGRGDTTRRLVQLLSGKPNARLIVTDLSDRFFRELATEFQSTHLQIEFLCTGGHEIHGIPDQEVDFLICNYTLCAINSQAGLAALALQRFWEVLKPGGKLFVEDEFPISSQDKILRQLWIEKWSILKSSMILAGQSPFNEISPELLTDLCYLAGFERVSWVTGSAFYPHDQFLDFFQRRLDTILQAIPNENLRAGYMEMALNLRLKATQVGGLEVPFYRLVAQKVAD